MKKEEVFIQEINYLSNEKYIQNIKKILNILPDYFYEIPASSTGKYHPSFALGKGGLVRHTKVAVAIAHSLLELDQYKNEFTKEEKDLLIMSLVLHDSIKLGLPEERYTRFDHPLLAGNFIEDHQDLLTLDKNDIAFLKKAIASHMGQWNTSPYSKIVLPVPTTKYEKFVHLCDYLASRKFLDVKFDDNNQIIN